MRFGNFETEKAEKRFWSIEVVESMVAFRINRAATFLKSEPIINTGSKVFAKDFRYEDKNALLSAEQVFNKKAPKVTLSLQQLESVLSHVKVKHPEIVDRLKAILD